MTEIYNFELENIDGKMLNFRIFENKPLLISNFASKCGLCDSNLKNFSMLKEKFPTLQILLFPSNDFYQEVEDYNLIKDRIEKVNKDFHIFKLTQLSGKNKSPLFAYLTKNSKGILGNWIKWNFTKWLINKHGVIMKRVGPNSSVTEEDIDLLFED